MSKMIYRLRFLFFTLYVLFATPITLYASDIRFEATVSTSRVSLGQGLQLNLTFHGSQSVPAPDLGDIKGFQSQYTGPSTRVSFVNGKISSSVTHTYTLVPEKTGTFKIGPLSVKYKGKSYTSNPVSVEVLPRSQTQRGSPQRESITSEDLGDRVFLIMEPKKRSVYMNEVIPLTMKLYVGDLSIRDIQYPKFDHEGFSVEDVDQPRQYKEMFNGKRYDVIDFGTQFFAVKEGDFLLGPATLECNLIVKKQRQRRPSFGGFFDDDIFNDFFGRYQTYPLAIKAPEISMSVLPLPKEGKPDDFKGATGDFKFHLEAGPMEVKTGDPITLKMTIEGEGNLNTVTPPVLASDKDFKVYEPQAKQEGDKKIFEQILIPETDKVAALPEVRFSFFNPDSERYQTITRSPLPLKVLKTESETVKIIESKSTESESTPVIKEILGRDIIYIKSDPGEIKEKGPYLYEKVWFWAIQAVALIIFTAFLLIREKREKLRTDTRYARSLKAPGKARQGIKMAGRLIKEKRISEFYDSVFKTLGEYLGDKFHMPVGGITPDIVERLLSERKYDHEITAKAKEIFMECDAARYTPEEDGKTHKADETFNRMKEVVDYLERQRA